MTSPNSIENPGSTEVNTLYPARVAYGTEQPAEQLAPIFGEHLLTADGCLVVPAMSAISLRPVSSGDPLAQRVINSVRRKQEDVETEVVLGDGYVVRQPGSTHTLSARACIKGLGLTYLQRENELIRDCILRWSGAGGRGLDPRIVLTTRGVEPEQAHTALDILQRHIGTVLRLSPLRILSDDSLLDY